MAYFAVINVISVFLSPDGVCTYRAYRPRSTMGVMNGALSFVELADRRGGGSAEFTPYWAGIPGGPLICPCGKRASDTSTPPPPPQPPYPRYEVTRITAMNELAARGAFTNI